MVKRKGVDPRSRDPKPHSKHEGLGKRGNPYGLEQNPLDDPTGAKYDNKNVRNVVQHPVDDPTGAGYDNKNPYALKQHPVNDPYGVKYDNKNVRNVEQHPDDDPYGIGYDNKNVRNVEQHPDDDPYGIDYSNKDPFASTAGTDFPHIRFRGNWEAGQELVRQAKKEMMLTASLAYKMGAPEYGRTILVDAEVGSYIRTQINGGIHSIEIVVPAIPPEEEVEVSEDEEIVEEPEILIYVGIYSGFAYNYNIQWELSDGPPPLPLDWRYRLHEFNPTEPCREAYPDDFDPGLEYQPITRLVMEPDSNIRTFGGDSWHRDGYRRDYFITNEGGKVEQSNLVHPCAYSGPMARVVSLALGNGHFNLLNPDDRELLLDDFSHSWWTSVVRSEGFRIAYDWHSDRTHGALQDNKGDWWLVEIAEYHGIVARRMPMIKYSFLPEDPEEQEAVKEFGGIPSGESFPNSTYEIDYQIDEGNFIRLMSVADYQETITDNEIFFSQAYGWCFNDTGSEGRTTTYNYEHVNSWMQCAYWKLNLSINTTDNGSSGTATITKIEEHIIAESVKLAYNGEPDATNEYQQFPISFYHPEADDWYNFQPAGQPWGEHASDIEGEYPSFNEAPVWVGWIEGEWHTIIYRWVKYSDYYRKTGRATFWPDGEQGTGKLDIRHTGLFPPGVGQDSFTLPEFVYATSYSPVFDLGSPIVKTHYDRSQSEVTQNVTDSKWDEALVRGEIQSSHTYIYKIKEVRDLRIEVRSRHNLDIRVAFAMTPYNRNAYYIQHREYQEHWRLYSEQYYRWVRCYGNKWSIANTNVNIDFEKFGGPPVGPGVPPPEAWVIPTASDGQPFNGYRGGFGGSWPFEYTRTRVDTNTGLNRKGCDDPDTAPPDKWFVLRDIETQADSLDVEVGSWPITSQYFPQTTPPRYTSNLSCVNYWVYDPSWVPTPLCGPIVSPKSDSKWHDADYPAIFVGTMSTQDLQIGADHYLNKTYLVADRDPTPGLRFIGNVGEEPDDDPDWGVNTTTPHAHCQVAVLGKKSIIYADNTNVEYLPAFGWPWYFPDFEYEGVQPEVIEGGAKNFYRRWLTYIGVNNP